MGGGKGGGGGGSTKQHVGYAYFLNMAYAFCDTLDSVLGFYLQETKVWGGDIQENEAVFYAKTGKNADLYGSGNGNSGIVPYLGSQVAASALFSGATGKSIAYKKVCYLVFPKSFIGDNVQSVPVYGLLGRRINIQSCSSLANYETYKGIPGTSFGVDVLNANPAFIIYDIFADLLKVPLSKLDSVAFAAAAKTLFDEKLGLSVVMTSSKKGVDWIKEILRYIDGFVYFNQATGKYTLKLLRKDYDTDLLPEVSVDIASDISLTRPSRAELSNTFTFKYANISGNETPKLNTTSMTNQANLEVAGYIKNTDVDLSCINSQEALAVVSNSMFNKMSYPTATLTFKISPLDFMDYSLGDVFIFKDTILTQNLGLIFRVIKVTGDTNKDDYLSIEAMEDIFSIGQTLTITPQVPAETPVFYTLPNPPSRIKVFPAVAENASSRAIHVAVSYPETTSVIQGVEISELYSRRVFTESWKYGQVLMITNNTGAILDRELVIRVSDPDGTFYEVFGTESDLQRLTYVAYWGEEAIGFKTCSEVSTGVYEFSGIIRGIQEKVTSHSVGESFWIPPYSGNAVPVLPITSIFPTVKAHAFNKFVTSPDISVDYAYQFTVETPYAPNSLQVISGDNAATLKWSPCVRLRGANYRNCDTIVAGENEGVYEGVFNLYYNGVLEETLPFPTIPVPFQTYPITKMGVWSIETQIEAYKSPKKSVTVTKSNMMTLHYTSSTLNIFGDNSCIALYRFEDNTNDTSNTYNATGTGISYIDWESGRAARFTGSTSFMNFGAKAVELLPEKATKPRTFSALVKFSASTDSFILSYGNLDNQTSPYFFQMEFSNTAFTVYASSHQPGNTFSGKSCSVAHGKTIALDTIYHIAFVFPSDNSGIVKFYLDSTYIGSGTISTWSSMSPTYDVWLQKYTGNAGTGYASYYKPCTVDQLRIFNRVLTDQEIYLLHTER